MTTSEERIREGLHTVPKLVSLIQNAAKIVEEHYGAAGVPSLDGTEAHPLDEEFITPAMREALQTIEGACEQLAVTIAKPKHTLMNVSLWLWYPILFTKHEIQQRFMEVS